MKTACLVVALALAGVGCAPEPPRTAPLDTARATDLAQRLANDRAEALFQCRPFAKSPPAHLVRGHWIWHNREGRGQLDVEADVKFDINGTNPNIRIQVLDSRADFPQFR